jgi:hypothetical protein
MKILRRSGGLSCPFLSPGAPTALRVIPCPFLANPFDEGIDAQSGLLAKTFDFLSQFRNDTDFGNEDDNSVEVYQRQRIAFVE